MTTTAVRPPLPDARARAVGAWRSRLRTSRWWLAAGVAVLAGLIAAWLTPRGPLTNTAAVVTMAGAASVGVLGGWSARSRWAALALPVTAVVAFEVARLDVAGPTVDAVSLDSTYGFIAFVAGRGQHGVLALAPMVLGALGGAALARPRSRARARARGAGGVLLWLRRATAALTAVALLVLAVVVARPAHTDPIRAADGSTLPGSVAELVDVPTGGHKLGLMLRGADTTNPVVLFLAGGPGGSELGAMRRHLQELEDHFVVATLDQRGTGRSYDELDPTDTLTVDSAVADVVAVTRYLLDRFDEQELIVVGNSWGTLLGVQAVQRHPELYAAFVGAGQMVSPRATDELFYEDTLAWARRSGRTDLAAELERLGPPPYADVRDYETVLAWEHDVYSYDHSPNSEGQAGMSENLLVEEYALVEQVHVLGAFLDTFPVLYPQAQDLDLRRSATRLEVPVILAQGAHEARGRAEPAEQWFAALDAPHKELRVFDTSGHRPLFEQPQQFVALMREVAAEHVVRD